MTALLLAAMIAACPVGEPAVQHPHDTTKITGCTFGDDTSKAINLYHQSAASPESTLAYRDSVAKAEILDPIKKIENAEYWRRFREGLAFGLLFLLIVVWPAVTIRDRRAAATHSTEGEGCES